MKERKRKKKRNKEMKRAKTSTVKVREAGDGEKALLQQLINTHARMET